MLFEDMVHFAAGNPTLRSPQLRSWNGTIFLEQEEAGERDHFFELQFLSALFCQICPDFHNQIMGTKDFEVFLYEACNNGSNLCWISETLHQEKNNLMTNKGVMTATLLLYLKLMCCRFQGMG